MAATQQKKTTGSRGKSSGSTQPKKSGRKAAPPPPPKPFYKTREMGGLVCLLLAFFAGIGYFSADGVFIHLFRHLLSGLFGWGFWLYPPALLLGAYVLIFHRGRPVRLRLACTLLLPGGCGAYDL